MNPFADLRPHAAHRYSIYMLAAAVVALAASGSWPYGPLWRFIIFMGVTAGLVFAWHASAALGPRHRTAVLVSGSIAAGWWAAPRIIPNSIASANALNPDALLTLHMLVLLSITGFVVAAPLPAPRRWWLALPPLVLVVLPVASAAPVFEPYLRPFTPWSIVSPAMLAAFTEVLVLALLPRGIRELDPRTVSQVGTS